MTNPYAPPSADLERRDVAADAAIGTTSRAVSAGRGWSWIAEGFGLFWKSPGMWIVNLLVLFAVSIVVSFIPIVGSIANSLLSPVFGAGLVVGSQALARGEPLTVGHLFAGFRRNTGALILVGLIYGVGAIVLMLAALAPTVGPSVFTLFTQTPNDPQQIAALFENPRTWIGALLACALLVPVIMAYWFAPSLVVLGNLPATTAMAKSFKACAQNMGPFLIYGIAGFFVMLLSAIPLGLGLLITVPAMIASIYTSLRDIFAHGDAAASAPTTR